VSIALFVRHKLKGLKRREAVIRYATVGTDWRKERNGNGWRRNSTLAS